MTRLQALTLAELPDEVLLEIYNITAPEALRAWAHGVEVEFEYSNEEGGLCYIIEEDDDPEFSRDPRWYRIKQLTKPPQEETK